MNQQHEAVRWLYQEKQLRPDRIARKLKLETASVHTILRKLGLKATRQHQVVAGPKITPAPVNRDPCTWCGTRGDLPCKHNRRAA